MDQFEHLKMFHINPPISNDQKNESKCDENTHLCPGLSITRGRSDGESGFALHDHVRRMQRADEGLHDVMALDVHTQSLLHCHVRQHSGGVGHGSISFTGQDVY